MVYNSKNSVKTCHVRNVMVSINVIFVAQTVKKCSIVSRHKKTGRVKALTLPVS